MFEPSFTDVQALIVGAGPTGLTMACELARHGITFRIVEKALTPSEHSKSVLLHARSLETFENLGIAGELVSHGLKIQEANIYAEGQRLMRVNFNELDSGFPYALSLPQRQTTQVLNSLLGRLGGEVERGVALHRFEQEAERVTAYLRHANGREEIVRAKWLLACDGIHSVVRNGLGLPFEGSETEHCFLLADVRLSTPLPTDGMHTFFAADGLASLIPLPNGLFRVVVNQTEVSRDQIADQPTLEELQALVSAHTGKEIFLREAAWIGRYFVHHRLTTQYRVGRIFLLGDAAHVQNPADGQGLNIGIQDAYNLGWKLGLVERAQAREEILDSYHIERRSIAENLLTDSDTILRVATLKHPVAQAIRNRVARFISHFEVVQNRLTRDLTMIGLNYRNSPLVDEHHSNLAGARLGSDEASEEPSLQQWRDFAAGPHAGDRAPDGEINVYRSHYGIPLYQLLQGTHHNLLLFDGFAHTTDGYANLAAIAKTIEDRFSDFIRVHIVVSEPLMPRELKWHNSVILDSECQLHYRYGAASECLYLIRPDGYVGYRCQPALADELVEYLERNLGVNSADLFALA